MSLVANGQCIANTPMHSRYGNEIESEIGRSVTANRIFYTAFELLCFRSGPLRNAVTVFFFNSFLLFLHINQITELNKGVIMNQYFWIIFSCTFFKAKIYTHPTAGHGLCQRNQCRISSSPSLLTYCTSHCCEKPGILYLNNNRFLLNRIR